MRALILAAGLGTRLRPLTDTVPKPLVSINGKPLLAYHLDHLKSHGITEILINTHYLPEQINLFVEEYRKNNPSVTINTVFEPNLLGSAGTLLANENFFQNETELLVVYGDNLTDINYSNLIQAHRETCGIATIAAYKEPHPEQKGVIEHDSGRIKRFVEKPRPGESDSNFANAGIYVLNASIFYHLKRLLDTPLDFGHHVFPHLVSCDEPMYIYLMSETLLDIGTFVNYERAADLLKTMKLGYNT